jgi:glycosyltransferase involved in cell wall biosynthesis
MKILMYAPVFPPMIGGPATQSAHLCRVLVEKGEDPVVLTVGDRFLKERSGDGYWVYRYPWRFTGTPIDKCIRWVVFLPFFMYVVWREKPVIIHAHAVSALTFVVGVYAWMVGIPSIVKFAGDWVWETLSARSVKAITPELLKERHSIARLLNSVQVFALKKFTVQWAPSLSKKRDLERLLGTTSTIEYIPNSLDLPDPELYPKKKSNGLLIVSANRFVPHKRVPLIVQIFERVARPEDRLVLIGTGEERELGNVRKLVEDSPRKQQITLTGGLPVEEVYVWLAQADIYVSSSLEEGMPNVFIEAMHFGVPIVATDVGGCGELVQVGKTGFLAPVDDDGVLEKHLRVLLENDELRKEMSDASRVASQAYDLHKVVQEFLDLYKRLTGV